MGDAFRGLRKAFAGVPELSCRMLRPLIIASLLGANLFIVAISAYSLYQSKQQIELRTLELTRNMADAVEQSLTNSIDKIDLALLAISDELERELATSGDLKASDARLVETILARYEQRLPEMHAIRVANADGLVIFGTGLNPEDRTGSAGRDDFISGREHGEAGLLVSQPHIDGAAKTPVIAFSRRFNTPDGRFAGVISAPVAVDVFTDLLSRFKVGPGVTVVLRDANLGLITRFPSIAGDPAGTIGNNVVSQEFRKLVQVGARHGSFYAPMSSDRQQRLVSFLHMDRAPMFVIVGMTSESYLAEWRGDIYMTAAGGLCFAILSLLAGGLVLRLLKEMAHENTRNRLYLHHASDGIHILDDSGRVVQASDQFCSMLGYRRSELIGMSASEWDARWPAEMSDNVLPGEPGKKKETCSFETRHRRKDGEFIDVELNAADFAVAGQKYLFVSVRDIGEKKRQQQALIDSEASLRESRERYRLLLGNTPVGILHFDAALIITYSNDRFEQIMKLPPGAALGLNCQRMQDQSLVPAMRQAIGGEAGHYEGRYVTTCGHVGLWISMKCAPVLDAAGLILGGIAVVEDITERKSIESQLRLAATVFSHTREGIMICDAGQTLLEVNPTFCAITGYTREQALGQTPKLLKSGRHDRDFYRAMWQRIADCGHWEGEVWNRHKDGGIYPERLTVTAVPDEQGIITHYIGTFSDISLFKQQQAELEQLAHYDALTQLPNRTLLADRMVRNLARAKRAGTLMAVAYLDLDGFKAINDEFGHDSGDALLVEMARRLSHTVRAGDTVARLGGDEFVLLFGGAVNIEECKHAANRVIGALAAPIAIREHECRISGSLGISLYPHNGSDPDTLLRLADQAMYLAKQAGKNCYRFCDRAEPPPGPKTRAARPEPVVG